MKSDTIIDSRLWISHDLTRTEERNSAFRANSANRAHLANQLLLYDRIVVPTNDFGIVPILINWFGLGHFKYTLESGSISFLRRIGLLGYAGNGNGICTFEIHPTSKKPFLWWQEALFGESERAIELQIRNMCPFVSQKERSALIDAIIGKTKLLQYSNELFKKDIVHESYTDIMKDNVLSSLSVELSGSAGSLDLTRLPSVSPKQLKVSRLDPIRDAADLVLRVAEINMDIMMSMIYGDCDLFTCEGAEQILRSKIERSSIPATVLEGFIKLLELNDIPDIGVVVASGQVPMSKILKLRTKRLSRKFRKWLRKAKPEDARELEKLYIKSLGSSGMFQSLPMRFLRFAIVTTAGIFNLPAGTAVAGANSFFVEKWLKGYSPKLFLDRLRKLVKN